eukprot:962-Heterococcus_DN1.PRE.1
MQLRPEDQSVLHLMHAAVSDATGDAPDEDKSDSPLRQQGQQLEEGDTPPAQLPAVENEPTEPTEPGSRLQEQPDDVSGSRTGSSHEADQLVLLPAVVPATVDDTTLADVPHKAVVEVANDTSSASVDSTADKSEHSAAADKNTGTDSADVDTDVVTDVNTDMNTNVHDSEQPARDSPQQQQQQQQQDHSDTATAVAVTGSHELAETLDSSEEQLQELTLQEQPLHQNDD